MTAGRRPTPPALAATGVVALGGAAGAVARWTAGEALPDGSGLPATTLAVNVVGTFLLAALPAVRAVGRRPLLGLLLGPGVLGGFTTFSAYAAQTRALATSGSAGLAATYLVVTVAACLVAAVAGRALAGGRRTAAGRDAP